MQEILARTEKTKEGEIPNSFVYKEHAAGKMGEKHSITTKKTKMLHKLLEKDFEGADSEGRGAGYPLYGVPPDRHNAATPSGVIANLASQNPHPTPPICAQLAAQRRGAVPMRGQQLL